MVGWWVGFIDFFKEFRGKKSKENWLVGGFHFNFFIKKFRQKPVTQFQLYSTDVSHYIECYIVRCKHSIQYNLIHILIIGPLHRGGKFAYVLKFYDLPCVPNGETYVAFTMIYSEVFA